MSDEAAEPEAVMEITAGNQTWLRVASFAVNNTERWRCCTPRQRLQIDCYYDATTGRWYVTCLQLGIQGRVLVGSQEWAREEACLRALVEIQKVLTAILNDISVHGT